MKAPDDCGEFQCSNKAVVMFRLKCDGTVAFCSQHAKNSNMNYLYAKHTLGIMGD